MMTAIRTVISTEDAPRAIGPYSQAIAHGDLVFCSGQIPLDPQTQLPVGGDDVSEQTRQVIANLTAVLAAAGSNWDRVVMATIYLTDLGDFETVNAIYAEAAGSESPPARATIQVAALPKGARVEIALIAGIAPQ